MNRSGEAVQACSHYYKILDEHILVVHDDMDLPLGRIRVAKGGGAGGHKGVASIMDHLGTRGFTRVRIGIGRPANQQPVEKFVLSPFSNSERDIVPQMIQLGIRACELFIVDGVDVAMNVINGQNLSSHDTD
jgi:PTH1 family peptidyl-tRNA hydrolase